VPVTVASVDQEAPCIRGNSSVVTDGEYVSLVCSAPDSGETTPWRLRPLGVTWNTPRRFVVLESSAA
jgi:hypothetical protein